MKRILVYLIEIIILYVIQSTGFQYMELAGVVPNLLLILVVSTAYMRGRIDGLLVGFACGLLVDLIFGNVIGLYGIFYMLIGYVIGYLHRYYSNDDFTLPLFFIGISNIVYGFFYYVFEFLLRGRLNFGYYFSHYILPETIYTVAVSVLLYKLLHTIHNMISRKPKEEDV